MENPEIKVEKENKEGTLYWTKKEPRKALATFQRNQNKMMINSLNQIDRKGAILIRINTTLISGIVVFFKYVSKLESGKLIGSVLIICCFISLILSILAIKPHLKKLMYEFKTKIGSKYPDLAENLFLVGAMKDVSLEEYEKGYNELVHNQELQIGNPIRFMFLVEGVINKSFKQLEWAFNIFIIGFIFTVVVFLLSNLTNLLNF